MLYFNAIPQSYIPCQNSVWMIYIFPILAQVAQSISTIVFVGRRFMFNHKSWYQHILLDAPPPSTSLFVVYFLASEAPPLGECRRGQRYFWILPDACGSSLASGSTLKRPCSILVWWWDGEQIKLGNQSMSRNQIQTNFTPSGSKSNKSVFHSSQSSRTNLVLECYTSMQLSVIQLCNWVLYNYAIECYTIMQLSVIQLCNWVLYKYTPNFFILVLSFCRRPISIF